MRSAKEWADVYSKTGVVYLERFYADIQRDAIESCLEMCKPGYSDGNAFDDGWEQAKQCVAERISALLPTDAAPAAGKEDSDAR